jgi:hypothetical protein
MVTVPSPRCRKSRHKFPGLHRRAPLHGERRDRFLPTFKALNVGLWGFDDATGIISQVFTPRPRRPPDR